MQAQVKPAVQARVSCRHGVRRAAGSNPVCFVSGRCAGSYRHDHIFALRQRKPVGTTFTGLARCWQPSSISRIATSDTEAPTTSEQGPAPLVAVEGDIVTVEYVCKDKDGNVIGSSAEDGEPATFEIGAGDVVGNKLFKAFDEAVRGLPLESDSVLRASGGEWRRELMFDVPSDHEEVQRLQKRYEKVGGLVDGLVVELANGQPAMVVSVGPEAVRLDANNMLAGKELIFELKLTSIERGE